MHLLNYVGRYIKLFFTTCMSMSNLYFIHQFINKQKKSIRRSYQNHEFFDDANNKIADDVFRTLNEYIINNR